MYKNLISIIIPVYNTEQYLKRCLDSVIKQSYNNLEIIVVNDASKGNVQDIVREYQKNDDRVKYVEHEVNRGLYHARLTGSSLATGDFIAFLDSDDYISRDFYHQLLRKANDTGADIVIGKTVWEKSNGYKYVYNLHDTVFNFEMLENECIQDAYFGQEGYCYSWHTIWNKLYTMKLWKRAIPYFEKQNSHIVMTEDIAFSSILFYFAKKITKTNNDAYFYCENANASTDVQDISFDKCNKNIDDIIKVFGFVEKFLVEVGAKESILSSFMNFKQYYFEIWHELINNKFNGKEQQYLFDELKKIGSLEFEEPRRQKFSFSSMTTEWKGGLEYLKDQICSNEYDYISFDIFDTLLLRPFFSPEDLFKFLDKKFEQIYKTNISFSKIRILGEEKARESIFRQNPSFEDITIEDIYKYIEKEYNLPNNIIENMMQEEINLELKFCKARECTKEIYSLAKILNKKIIIISDMYLKEEHIKVLLSKNGYDNYDKLYVSSELKLTKSIGSMYKYVIKELKINPASILHIGDNWQSDIQNAQKYGFNTFFLPKTIEVFCNKINDLNTNRCSSIGNIEYGDNLLNSKSTIGFKTMLAMISNKYFDNPFRVFNSNSDFNMDPYFIGYYLLGMNSSGIMKWIEENIYDYDKICFLSRDGYLLNKLWTIKNKYISKKINCEYIYSSRKLLLPAMLDSKIDFYDLPLEFKNHTPKSVLNILKFCCDIDDEQMIKNLLYDRGILFEKTFLDKREYNMFIKVFLEDIYNENKHMKKIEELSKYYSRLSNQNIITFDMGYSGRIQGALSRLAKKSIPGLFIHNDGHNFFDISRKKSINIKCLYSHIPLLQDFIREYLFSDKQASCVDISYENDRVKLEFEQVTPSVINNFILDNIQLGCIDFYKDFIATFSEFEEYIPFNIDEVMYPLESFFNNITDIDSQLFKLCEFDDYIYGGSNQIGLMNHLKHSKEINIYNYSSQDGLLNKLNYKNKFIKLIVYGLIDKELLRVKVWYALQKHPFWFRAIRKIYRIFNKI